MRRKGLWWVLAALFVAVPLAELFLLIQLGQVIGPWWTILVLLADGVLGSWLVKREGGRAWRALSAALSSGRMPSMKLDGPEAEAIAMYLLRDQVARGRTASLPGLQYEYYERDFPELPEFDRLKPTATGIAEVPSLKQAKREGSYALRWRGNLSVPKGGKYKFYLNSDDPYKRGIPGTELSFAYSYGDPQPVAVNAKRSVGPVTVKWRVNGGPVQSGPTSECIALPVRSTAAPSPRKRSSASRWTGSTA